MGYTGKGIALSLEKEANRHHVEEARSHTKTHPVPRVVKVLDAGSGRVDLRGWVERWRMES